ncbi:MAG: SurA N-terminal domain-containing protein, partial [Spirochaetales bacterium]|nr:SurA N-terminal domain-containing protein [Spirochaetales bacterium]
MASREQRRNNRKLSQEKIDLAEKRRSTNKGMWIITVIILVVIVVTFVGAPVLSKASSNNTRVFGSYDGEEIIYNDGSFFYDQVNTIADNYRDSINDQNAFFIQYQVWRTAFNNTLVRTAAISKCKKSGYLVSDSAIDNEVVLHGPYMENGEFSENIYKQSSDTEKNNVRSRLENNLYYTRFITDLNAVNFNNNEEKFFTDIAKTEK